MLRHPILIAFDEKRLRRELKNKRALREVPLIVIPYKADGTERLQIPLLAYNSLQPGVARILDGLRRTLNEPRNRSISDAERIGIWSKATDPVLLNHKDSWRMLLHEFANTRAERWPDEPGVNQTLGEAFVREVLGIKDRGSASIVEVALRVRCEPALSRERVMQMAFDLEEEKVTDQIVRDTGKLVVLAVLLLVPFGQVPAVIGAVSTAVAGFLQFMQFLEDAESDGEITEEEVKEAEWQMYGILPFNLIQNVLMFRAIGMVVEILFVMLIDGINSLIESLGRRKQAIIEGWTGYNEHSAEDAIFIPDYAFS
jgi:hypothetical protein